MSNPWTEVYRDIREPFLQEKMAKKDYDGDGKIETGTQEYMGSRDKAIKKAMGKDPKKEMNKESMHSSNPAQQAAIAMAKKKREEDMMVDKKKKMKEEKYDNRYSDNTGEESKKKKAALEKKRGMKLDDHPQFKREMKEVQPPAQKLKTDRNMFQIPKSEQDAARERVLAKTKAKREKMAKEDVEPVIEEMEPFGLFMDMFVEQELEEEVMDDILEIIYEKCWKGYEKKGMKTMFGKRYPNCVKKEEVEEIDEIDEAKVDKKLPSGPFFGGAKERAEARNKRKFGKKDSGIDVPYKRGNKYNPMSSPGGSTEYYSAKRGEETDAKRGVKKIRGMKEAVYGGEKEPDKRQLITQADKTNKTPAYQNYMKKMKHKVTGKPMYKGADHLKDD